MKEDINLCLFHVIDDQIKNTSHHDKIIDFYNITYFLSTPAYFGKGGYFRTIHFLP